MIKTTKQLQGCCYSSTGNNRATTKCIILARRYWHHLHHQLQFCHNWVLKHHSWATKNLIFSNIKKKLITGHHRNWTNSTKYVFFMATVPPVSIITQLPENPFQSSPSLPLSLSPKRHIPSLFFSCCDSESTMRQIWY